MGKKNNRRKFIQRIINMSWGQYWIIVNGRRIGPMSGDKACFIAHLKMMGSAERVILCCAVGAWEAMRLLGGISELEAQEKARTN